MNQDNKGKSETWGGLLNNYRNETRNLGYKFPKRSVQITRKRGMRLARTRNPITHTFYKPDKEKTFVNRQKQIRESHIKRGFERQKFSESNYNIINLQPNKGSDLSGNKLPLRKARIRKHPNSTCKVDYDSLFMGKNRSSRNKKEKRQYNIISNKYYENDLIKKKENNKKFRENVMKKYESYVKNKVDPIFSNSSTPKNQTRIRTHKRIVKHSHNAKKIRNPVLGNHNGNDNSDTNRQRGKSNGNKFYIEQRMNENARKKERLSESRKHGRSQKSANTSAKKEIIERGYDIVSGKNFKGINGREPMWFKDLNRERSYWDKIKGSKQGTLH